MENMYDEVINVMRKIERDISSEIETQKEKSFKEGYNIGFNKGFNLGSDNLKIDRIDWDSIKVFSSFCYINGIDFSYMGKSSSTFTERVTEKFKKAIENNDISVKEYKNLIVNQNICKCKYCGIVPDISSYEDYENIEDYYYIKCDNPNCNSEEITKSYNISNPKAKSLCISEWNKLNGDVKSVKQFETFDDIITSEPELKLGEFIQLFLLGYDDKIYITVSKGGNEYDELFKNIRIISKELIPYYDNYISYFAEPDYEDQGTLIHVILK